MQILVRLPLPSDVSLRDVPVRAFDNAYYTWRHRERHFLFEHNDGICEDHGVMKLATAMRVTIQPGAKPQPSPMIPPLKGVELTAWEFGFGKRTHRHDLEKARTEAEALKITHGGQYRFIIKSGFVFVFEPPPIRHAELKSVLWAIGRGIGTHDVKPVLSKHCRYQN